MKQHYKTQYICAVKDDNDNWHVLAFDYNPVTTNEETTKFNNLIKDMKVLEKRQVLI